jgi:hypothetical protein
MSHRVIPFPELIRGSTPGPQGDRPEKQAQLFRSLAAVLLPGLPKENVDGLQNVFVIGQNPKTLIVLSDGLPSMTLHLSKTVTITYGST